MIYSVNSAHKLPPPPLSQMLFDYHFIHMGPSNTLKL